MNPISDNIIQDGERLNAEIAKRVKSGTGMTFQNGALGELQAYIAELVKANKRLSVCEDELRAEIAAYNQAFIDLDYKFEDMWDSATSQYEQQCESYYDGSRDAIALCQLVVDNAHKAIKSSM